MGLLLFPFLTPILGSPYYKQIHVLGPSRLQFWSHTKARFFFHWCDWCLQQALANGAQPLWLNFDEASIPKGQVGLSGAVIGRLWWPHGEEPLDSFAGKHRKTCLSLLLTVAAEDHVQQFLPQIFLGNRSILPAGIEAVQFPGSSEFWRQRSAWNCEATMIRYFDRLASALEGQESRQIILIYDAASMHVTERVVRYAAEKHFWLVVVPPGCTFGLQPADRSVFGSVKLHLRQQMELLKQEAPGGAVSHMAWLRSLLPLPNYLQSRSWQRAFERCGVIGDRMNLSPVFTSLQGHHARNPAGAVAMPTPEAMRQVYGQPIASKHWLFMQQTVPALE